MSDITPDNAVELSKALKDLSYRIQTSSLSDRKKVILSVQEVLCNEGINEQIVRGICKIMSTTLVRYSDSKSQSLVKVLLRELAKIHPQWTLNALLPILFEFGMQYKNVVAVPATAHINLVALSWTCILIKGTWKSKPELVKANIGKICETQMYLMGNVFSAGHKKKSESAQNLIKQLYTEKSDLIALILDHLKTLEINQYVPVFVSQFCQKEKDLTHFDHFLDVFIKAFITVKIKPSKHLLEGCYPLLSLEKTAAVFSTTLLPSMQKSLLRSPEIIIECIGCILAGLSCNVCQYAVDLGKSLVTNLHSKEELTRENAAEACRKLSKRIANADALRSLLKHTFGVFNGSDGKLTVLEHKLHVLKGIGNMSDNNVSLNDELLTTVFENFAKVLEVESHEKVLCYALEMLSLWTAQFKSSDKVIELFKKGFSLKSSTPLVKSFFIRCLFSSPNLNIKYVVPLLTKSLEKSASQPTQHQVLMEGLSAACLLLKYFNQLEDCNESSQILWHVISDMGKPLFLSDKFLATAQDDVLEQVLFLCCQLISKHSSRLNGNLSPIYRAIAKCCISFTTQKGKESAANYLKQLAVANVNKTMVSECLIQEMADILDKNKLRRESEEKELSVSSLINSLLTICSAQSENSGFIALQVVILSHHPALVAQYKNLWRKILKCLKINTAHLMENHLLDLQRIFVNNYQATASYEAALASIVSTRENPLLPKLVQSIIAKLDDERIRTVSKDDFFTFLTPEDELYDKSVIPGDDSNAIMNMKRESRAYSFKEQQEELQLRRELEEKKRKEGKIKPPQYTPKQLEAIKNQKVKEQIIRDKLKELDVSISCSVSIIRALSAGNSQELAHHFKDLISILLKNCCSPLSASPLVNLFINLRKCVFQPQDQLYNFSNIIANVTIALIKPQCDLETNWSAEEYPELMKRIINQIHEVTLAQRQEDNDETEFTRVPYLTSPALTYCFPLINIILSSKYAKKDETLMHDGLQLLSEHAKLRINNIAYHPNWLPRRQLFELLVQLINTTSGRIQSQAEATLIDVAASASGYENCAVATLDEIDILLGALQKSNTVVRDAALRGLTEMRSSIESNSPETLKISKRILIAKFDVHEPNRILANALWDEANLKFPVDLSEQLLEDIEHPVECIQIATAEALAFLLRDENDKINSTLEKLISLYKERLAMIPAKVDEFGREIEKPIDLWGPRRGVAIALTKLAPLLAYDVIGKLVEFFVNTALSDRQENVRKEMLSAALMVVEVHGKETVSTLLPVFENFMDKSSKSSIYDHVKQAVVILMGSLARHLEKDDPRIKPIVQRLISALSTPSQQVQESVANCLPHLVPSVKEEAPGYINKLLHQLLKGDKYGDRKGAAYGLAGMVKGMGILVLKQLDIMTKLTDAIQDKKNYKHREGALFAFEMLFQMLGKLFEPYIVHVLPHLLLCFGDSSQYVRAATDDTAKVVMSKLSGHGVKLVLPHLLQALEDDSWRTKTGSVELLGAMAYCAPKQLSSCLPSIVPKLIEVLSDSHMKVQEAGAEALKVIGSVIRNPEIQAIVPVLLSALQDPSNKTSTCLQTLLDTKFVHFIDAPSLALIMPVVQRAFMDRSTETRKMAAQIIGNMYSLTDQKDLMPYLPTIIPGLKTSLLDPVPEVRSVSARALGAMVRGMGESSFEDLLPWLMQTLTSESSSVDRSGAAQGLSEVVGGLGVEKLHKLMPDIIATAERTDIAPHVKDGYIMMFIYMPVVFQSDFTPYIGQIITPILKALADENEYVRDTALKAGQRIVNLYADSAIQLLLPELEKGLFDDNWRIRYSSVQLLGDLLYRISGVTGKMSTETASEDDNFGTEQSHEAIIISLGGERRNRVLAGLYMGRSDVALMVRQAALHVWKVVVTNTPRTLREILPTLFGLLLGCLASDSYDKRQVAARTLGDLVRKLGERVLPDIIPILEKGLQSDRPDQRQGVCIGLSEIMASTSREMVLSFVSSLVPTVRKALCDPLPEVRKAAAKTFDSLHTTVGTKALDDILPPMLQQLNDEDSEVAEWTLDGLRQVMAIKSRVVLPYLVPQLISPPTNTKALSILASVAGEALNKYLNKILPALQNALAIASGTPEEAQELEYCQAVVLSIVDEAGVRTVIDCLLESTRNPVPAQRKAAATLLCAFCANTRAQYTTHVPQLYRGLIYLCTDTDKDVLQMTWEALNAVTKSLDGKQQATYVPDIRQAVRYAILDSKTNCDVLPGFCLPKGIAPLLPIFREAILNGDGDEKEAAAQGLGEVIKLTNAAALQTSVVSITGPLIRILGDRFNPNVKTAVLETLAILLSKVGLLLKQFLPQLQTTFVKSLNDTNRIVRLKSAHALSHLILIHQRPDPLFLELHNTMKNSDDVSIRETTLHALRGIITPAGDKMTEPVRKQILQTLTSMLGHSDDVTRLCAAGCFGAMCQYLPVEQLETTLNEYLLNDDQKLDWTLRHGRAAALSVTLKESPGTIWTEKFMAKLEKTILSQLASEKIQITQSAIRSTGYLLQYLMNNEQALPINLLGPFVKTMNNPNNDVKQLLARVSTHLARVVPTEKMAPEFLKLLLPMLVNGTKEKNGYVKANSEFALIEVLKLKDGDEINQKYLKVLDVGARESLTDVISKVLKKIMRQSEGKDEELDDTLLT